MEVKHCVNCGSTLTSSNNSSKYCSNKKCKNEYQKSYKRNKRKEHTCPQCGVTYRCAAGTGTYRYCSLTCKNLYIEEHKKPTPEELRKLGYLNSKDAADYLGITFGSFREFVCSKTKLEENFKVQGKNWYTKSNLDLWRTQHPSNLGNRKKETTNQ